MPTQNATVGVLDGVAGFLQGFMDGYRQMQYLKLQQYNTYQAPAERARMQRELEQFQADLAREAADYQKEAQKNLELWRETTLAPQQLGSKLAEQSALTEQKLGFAPRIAEAEQEAYKGMTPLEVDRAVRKEGATEAARLKAYSDLGLTPSGTRGGAGPGAGTGLLTPEEFQRISLEGADDVTLRSKNEIEAMRQFGDLSLTDADKQKMLAFNQALWPDALNQATLARLRPRLSAQQFGLLTREVAGGRAVADVLSPMIDWSESAAPQKPENTLFWHGRKIPMPQTPKDDFTDEELKADPRYQQYQRRQR